VAASRSAMPNLSIYLVAISATSATAAGACAPPVSLTLVLGAACCSAGLLAGVVGLGIWLAISRRQGDDRAREK
jgi:hypothetical protein